MDDGLSSAVRAGLEARVQAAGRLVDAACIEEVVALGRLLVETYNGGKKALLFGNGGSAADAQHIAAELVGKFRLDRSSLPALALTTNSSTLSAVANDLGYEQVFARQVDGFGSPGDVAIGLSTSGESENVVRGLACARSNGLSTAALTGADARRMTEVADVCVRVPSADTPIIQEGHIVIGHILCDVVEQELFGAGDR
jgi:D-sedoheptulose 7-phosphate isomerase